MFLNFSVVQNLAIAWFTTIAQTIKLLSPHDFSQIHVKESGVHCLVLSHHHFTPILQSVCKPHGSQYGVHTAVLVKTSSGSASAIHQNA